jgi:hypothetical protein
VKGRNGAARRELAVNGGEFGAFRRAGDPGGVVAPAIRCRPVGSSVATAPMTTFPAVPGRPVRGGPRPRASRLRGDGFRTAAAPVASGRGGMREVPAGECSVVVTTPPLASPSIEGATTVGVLPAALPVSAGPWSQRDIADDEEPV